MVVKKKKEKKKTFFRRLKIKSAKKKKTIWHTHFFFLLKYLRFENLFRSVDLAAEGDDAVALKNRFYKWIAFFFFV